MSKEYLAINDIKNILLNCIDDFREAARLTELIYKDNSRVKSNLGLQISAIRHIMSKIDSL